MPPRSISRLSERRPFWAGYGPPPPGVRAAPADIAFARRLDPQYRATWGAPDTVHASVRVSVQLQDASGEGRTVAEEIANRLLVLPQIQHAERLAREDSSSPDLAFVVGPTTEYDAHETALAALQETLPPGQAFTMTLAPAWGGTMAGHEDRRP